MPDSHLLRLTSLAAQDVVQELQLQNQLVAANDEAVAEAKEAAIMSDKAHTQVLVPLRHAHMLRLLGWRGSVEAWRAC